VLDATTGQNAVNQAREFKSVADITGIVLTKLDGTARGGVVLAIKNELDIAVKFVGVGEQIDDLQPFKPLAFADGLFDRIDYKDDEDEFIPIAEEVIEEPVEEIIEEPVEEIVEDEIIEEVAEPEAEEEPQEEEQPKKKEKRGFFGLFNRNS
jgi:signal recognition particle GTPase